MSDDLQITPDGVRKASKDLHDTSGQIKEVLTALNSKLDAEGAPWGQDSTGKQFADGPSGYLAQLDWVNNSVGEKTKLLDQYSGSMKDTADTMQHQDQG